MWQTPDCRTALREEVSRAEKEKKKSMRFLFNINWLRRFKLGEGGHACCQKDPAEFIEDMKCKNEADR